jgi:antitoxin (DNA-binding transcriptional repressor) of toxin-antitoxin stability system
MSTEPKRMKSDEVRVNWRDVLDLIQAGGTVIVERYNKPIATITPYKPTPYEEEEYALASANDDCPSDNCMYGHVAFIEYPQDDGTVIEAGKCGDCTAESVKCPECETLTLLVWHSTETPCEGCDAVFVKDTDRKGETDGFRRVR